MKILFDLYLQRKSEPDWLLEFRLKSYRHWLTMKMPDWAHLNIPEIDFQDIIYYADPRKKKTPKNREDVDPELLKTFDRLGIPLHEQEMLAGVAVDAVMDSVSVKTTYKETLAEVQWVPRHELSRYQMPEGRGIFWGRFSLSPLSR